jgi:hypothetical protein
MIDDGSRLRVYQICKLYIMKGTRFPSCTVMGEREVGYREARLARKLNMKYQNQGRGLQLYQTHKEAVHEV